MTLTIVLLRMLACACLLLAAILPSVNAQITPYGPHLWDKPLDPNILEHRVDNRLARAQNSLDQLLSVKGPRTVENTLAPYDDAVMQLDTAGNQSGLMQIVNPDAAIRDRAQAMVQKVSAAGTALSLNTAVYQALSSMDVSKADAATQYYVSRTLLEFRLAGVDKDEATRAKIKALSDDITKLAAQFQRNIQESQLKVSVKDPAELAGLPADFISRHQPAPDGS